MQGFQFEDMNCCQHALASSRPLPVDNSLWSDDIFVQEQDHERRPAASAGPLQASLK